MLTLKENLFMTSPQFKNNPSEQFEIKLAAKKLYAYSQASQNKADVENCSNCVFMKMKNGKCCCSNAFAIAIADETAVKNGSFKYPNNCDPNYLLFCDGYVQNEN